MDSRMITTRPKALPKAVLLKDYLLDDFSSCSSNGFKSFPRRQCCTSMRFLIQAELKKKQNILPPQNNKYLNFSPKKPPKSSALSAFQSVITAVKRLPFTASGSSSEKKKSKKSFLARNFSRKILKKSFWKRKSNSNKEIPRWISFNQWLKDEPEPHSIDSSESKSDSSLGSESKSDSSLESEFTEFSSGNSAPEANLNLPEEGKESVKAEKEAVSNAVGVVKNDDFSTGGSSSTTGSDGGAASTNSSTDTKNKSWPSDEKEQFSPVSVLDCPFDDEVSSPFRHGSKNKLMKKIQIFASLTQLEPVNLSKRFAMLPGCDNEQIGSPLSLSSNSIDEKFISDIEDEEEQEEEDGNQVEQKAIELLDQLKETMPSYGLKLKADKLLLEFFEEKIVDSKKHRAGYSFDEEVLEEAEHWINELKHNDLLVDLEVQKNRQSYIRDMEKGGEWKTLGKENEELALELEIQVFTALLDDLLLDIS